MDEVELVAPEGKALQQVALDEGVSRRFVGLARDDVEADHLRPGKLLADVEAPLPGAAAHVQHARRRHRGQVVPAQDRSERVVLDVQTVDLAGMPGQQVLIRHVQYH